MRRFLLAAIAFGAMSSAHAADLPFLRGGFTDGYSRGPVNWQGIYIGGQGSWGSEKSAVPGIGDLQSFVARPGVAPYVYGTLTSTVNNLNGGYGAFFGYNSQYEDVVIGIEGNYIHDGFHATTAAPGVNPGTPSLVQSVTYSSETMRLPDFGSVRLRGGYMMGCFLPYLFVGAGFGEQTIDRAVSASPSPVGPAWLADSKSKLIYGYTAGIGFDVQLTGGLFGRFEYEYKRVTSDFESIINTARVGLGYKF